jgi:Na+/proline symporter
MRKKPETPEEERDRKLRELEGKNISHYSVMLAAYVSARVDANKAIFAFSSAGIGVLVAVWYGNKLKSVSACTQTMYLIALVAFLIAVITTLFVHVANANIIESYITQSDEKTKEFKLKSWMYVNYFAFGAAVCFTVATLISYVVSP